MDRLILSMIISLGGKRILKRIVSRFPFNIVTL